jgi:hypothetical protein
MELTDDGFYKTPRIIKGLAFLSHIHDVLDCGNEMYIQFRVNEEPEKVLSYQKLYDTDYDNSVLFILRERPQHSYLIQNIAEFEFIQYRPQTSWKAIHMGSTKRINIEQFEELYINDTFHHLHPVIFNHASQFWNVMGLELAVDEAESVWYLYLKRQDSDFMTRIKMPLTQKFLYNPLSNSWALDDPTEEITDHEKIKEVLRKDGVWDITVSGVPMKLIRVMNIAADILFFVFKDEEDKSRYYYARRSTKLRIVTDAETREVKYLLDHVKAIHVD